MYYEPDSLSKKIYLNLVTDLEGISFDIISPIKKEVNEKKILKLSYNFDKKHKNKLNIFYDNYNFVITDKKDTDYCHDPDRHYIILEISLPGVGSLPLQIRCELHHAQQATCARCVAPQVT